MRNQFGGHAVRTEAPPGGDAPPDDPTSSRRDALYVAHLTPARLPLLRHRRGRARAGRDGVHRPQRAGQDQPGRGDRLPVPAQRRTGSRPTRRWCGRRRPGGGPRRGGHATAARRCSRSRSTPAGPTGRGSTGSTCRGPATWSAWSARWSSRPRTSPWSRATRPSGGAFLDDLLVLRTPRLAGVRADYDRVLKQRNSLLKTAGAARRGSARRSRRCRPSAVWDAQLARTGAELLADAARAGRRAAPVRRQGLRDRGARGEHATTPSSTTSRASALDGLDDRRPTAPT